MLVKIGITAITLFFLASGAGAAASGPKAALETDTYDFGSVLEGDHVIHPFIIKNIGDALLKVTDVRTG